MTGLIVFNIASAGAINVEIYSTKNNAAMGTISFKDTGAGLLITPNLTSLSPGIHGFHIHQFSSCGDNGNKAGGHYDPKQTKSHLGPYQSGHDGDLPALMVNKREQAKLPLLAPNLKVSDLYGHSVMIHLGGDNYSDTPNPLGGGGARLACGVIKVKKKGLG